MWFKRKKKKEWTVRTGPPCQHPDCMAYKEFEWKHDNYSRSSGFIDPLLITCLMCSEFKRTNCYIKKEE
jgi:hypothetical protein